MPSKINISGQRFGRLIVIRESTDRKASGSVMWLCRCDCGNEKIIQANSLRSGRTTSCGCNNKERVVLSHTTHGESSRKGKSLTYLSWDAMIQRCFNQNSDNYKFYGGIGVSVCERWLVFKHFKKDMGERPSKKYTIDRYPNTEGNYEPNNCRWATIWQQSRNKRSNVWVEHNGVNKIMTDWATEFGTSVSVIRRSLSRGKTFDQIYLYYKSL